MSTAQLQISILTFSDDEEKWETTQSGTRMRRDSCRIYILANVDATKFHMNQGYATEQQKKKESRKKA